MRTSGGAEDWNTPGYILEAVSFYFGGEIDLDPCSNLTSLVGAKKNWILPEHDGLREVWGGNVWCNPPFSRGCVLPWAEKAAHAVMGDNCGVHVASTLFICPASTETAYFQDVIFPEAKAICFLNKRVEFLRPDRGPTTTPQTGHAISLFSDTPDLAKFSLAFEGLGWIQT